MERRKQQQQYCSVYGENVCEIGDDLGCEGCQYYIQLFRTEDSELIMERRQGRRKYKRYCKTNMEDRCEIMEKYGCEGCKQYCITVHL